MKMAAAQVRQPGQYSVSFRLILPSSIMEAPTPFMYIAIMILLTAVEAGTVDR